MFAGHTKVPGGPDVAQACFRGMVEDRSEWKKTFSDEKFIEREKKSFPRSFINPKVLSLNFHKKVSNKLNSLQKRNSNISPGAKPIKKWS